VSGGAGFTVEGFRDAVATALTFDPAELSTRRPAGDHILNPDFSFTTERRFKEAAVLIPVIARRPEATVLFTRRTATLTSHSGQIAFPGGRIDDTDQGPVEAALREAVEEIALDPRHVQPIGMIDPYFTGSGYRITPVVGVVDPDYRAVPNPDEVAGVFEVPLGFLMRETNHARGSRAFQGIERAFYVMPYGSHYIWGVTAGIVRRLYELSYGRP
jgi:8-oxo-dGTP pyrophosphatase MutT (NUDIX family)